MKCTRCGYTKIVEDFENPEFLICENCELRTPNTVRVLCDLLEWAKGNRGSKDNNPYSIPEIKAALKHLAMLQGIKVGNNCEWMDAKTA